MKINDSCENKTISQLFEQCVEAYSENIAVYSSSKTITYKELNEKANILANYLRQCGIKRNDLVAVYLERSIDFIICILAIVKAGGAYIPLDTDTPLNRNLAILQDSHPSKIITNNIQKNSLHEILSNHELKNSILNFDLAFQKDTQQDSQNPNCINDTNDLVYVMYTSGSTGLPKGCMIPQRGVIRLVKNTNYISIVPEDHIAQIANIAFDASTFEIWGALLNGATLHIIPKNILLSLDDLTNTVQKNAISIVFVTTALFNLIVKSRPDCFDRVRYLLFGGEKANPILVQQILQRKKEHCLNHLTLINMYGPTECTTFATFFKIETIDDIKDQVPIGETISKTIAYILDENLKPVPLGNTGELYLGGEGLALGYLNNFEETNTKFIHCPWKPKEKIYRTGDLVRRTTGLVFIDRIGFQIKIRGFRIEPGDIESCITKFPMINQVAIATVLNKKGENSLIAYITLNPAIDRDFAKFRAFLKKNLPHYMIPSKIICVDDLPLNSNGKIDRKKLADLKGLNVLSNAEKPSNELERNIADILILASDIPEISVTENFFDLGISSLMLSDICSLLNSKLNDIKQIKITDIFTYPTIRSLAAYLKKNEEPKANFLENDSKRAIFQRKMLAQRRGAHAI